MYLTYSATMITILLDLIEAAFLVLLLFIVAPLKMFHDIRLKRLFSFLVILVPRGLLSAFLRALIDIRLDHFDRAVTVIESTIGTLEERFSDRPRRWHAEYRTVLIAVYTLLIKNLLQSGHMDDAALAMIRAARSLSLDRLPGLGEFDFKAAQILRAGLAAGKLLDQNNSTATVMLHGPIKSGLSDVSKVDAGDKKSKTILKKSAKIIPFPTSPNLH